MARFGIRVGFRRTMKALRGVLVVARKLEEIAQRGLRLGRLRVERDGPPIGCDRLAMQALPTQRQAEIAPGRGVVSQGGRQAQACGRLGEAIEAQQQLAERVVRSGFPRIEADGAAKGGKRSRQPSRLDQRHAAFAGPPGGGALVGGDTIAATGRPRRRD